MNGKKYSRKDAIHIERYNIFLLENYSKASMVNCSSECYELFEVYKIFRKAKQYKLKICAIL